MSVFRHTAIRALRYLAPVLFSGVGIAAVKKKLDDVDEDAPSFFFVGDDASDSVLSSSSSVHRTPVLFPASRDSQLTTLRRQPVFDVVVIGAGALGSSIALDASTRGMRVCLIDKGDLGSRSQTTGKVLRTRMMTMVCICMAMVVHHVDVNVNVFDGRYT